MRKNQSKRFYHSSVFCLLLSLVTVNSVRSALEDNSIRSADAAFVRAVETRDVSALEATLDENLVWINSHGTRFTRAEVLRNVPAIANATVQPDSRDYGSAELVHVNQGKMNVLRLWVKRGPIWKMALYQEVLQVETSEPARGKPSSDCVNPCKSIPFVPRTQSENDVIASWQGVMLAMAENDAVAYSALIAEEFTATDTYHDRPYSKADRLAQISKQKSSGTHSSPPELLSAEMFDYGENIVMVAREQRPGANSYFNTRMWTKRDGRWQMAVSFNTRIE
jgi:hypothetical protein